ncbi:N-acetylmuramoyl-L-alanine amidase family protein [Fulvivirga sedimenti]|uniref:N-acetylmuramoyl-L-alanine amidase n=1 Tax=Fulvivirga sedimenti TaxID=2879465 RepID=A0A9X1HPT2_9BACT|nr:N-acetylmuramoyl-L-alanine amidase [Fulvivirga sedimenti]MCA6074099.1 N-acetylmuramoyl-L-alanine amidase [Fulvivirga sedimenti]
MARRFFCALVVALVLVIPFQLHSQDVVPDTVIAQTGEGIFAILRRTDRNPANFLPDFIALNKHKLGSDSSLVKGQVYLIPPITEESKSEVSTSTVTNEKTVSEASSRMVEPLFGSKYKTITLKDEQLKGAVYYLVSGHSGPDPGAIGQYGPYELSEDEYAYDVTLRLARRLMEHGATVYMIVKDEDDGIRDEPILTLDTDERHYPDKEIPYSQRARLRDRVAVVNDLYSKHQGAYQRMLAIHIDSRSRGENIDVFFYHHMNSVNGRAMATSIHETFTKKYKRHQPNRNYYGSVSSRSSLYVVKYSYPPTVFIELGNIKNEKDQRRFVLADNRQALANWIAEGIISDRNAHK